MNEHPFASMKDAIMHAFILQQENMHIVQFHLVSNLSTRWTLQIRCGHDNCGDFGLRRGGVQH